MKKKIFLLFMIILTFFVFFIIRFTKYYDISCQTFSENGIKGNISQMINEKVLKFLEGSPITYEEITNVSYDNDGNIKCISLNTTKLNMISAELSNLAFECISNAENRFGIPLGNTLGSTLTSGKGPKIEMKVVPIGAIDHNIKTELISGGINQTIHRISIELKTTINCLAPFHNSELSISRNIIIAETLIIGKVPNTIFSTD